MYVVYNLEQLEEKKVIDMEIPEIELTTKYLCYQTQSETDGKSCIPIYRAADPEASDQHNQKKEN